MKLWLNILNIILTCNLMLPVSLYASPEDLPAPHKSSKRTFKFKFIGKSLVDVINAVAAAKEANIVLPSGADVINNKVTIALEDKVSPDEAWNLLLTILDAAGYSLLTVDAKNDMYRIRKTTGDIAYNTFPLYVNIAYTDLPDTAERIGYLYYFNNVRISEPSATSEIDAILKGLLPANSKTVQNKESNTLFISAQANNIRSVMEIITTLDKAEFQESLEIITLHHTSAKPVADMFNDEILKNTAQPINRINNDKKSGSSSYFSQNIRLIPMMRTNSLIMIGRRQAIDRVKEFIHKYIDVELESGESILHVYELQYLNAAELRPVLKNIIDAKGKSSGQSKSEGEGSIERFFEGVIIMDDSVLATNEASAQNKSSYGGNRLIIAARNKDWKRISKIIEELDTPQQQVIIEVLIADVTIADSRVLNSMARNFDSMPLPEQVNIQSAQAAHVIGDNGQAPTTIKSDLLRDAFNASGNYVTDAANGDRSLAALAPAGTTVLSISSSDGKTYGILEMLKKLTNSRILSHPHVIAKNNNPALVTISESRLVDDAASASANTTTVSRTYIPAPLKVTVTPRINADSSVNLSIKVTIEEFLGTTGADRISRTVETNVNIKDKDILALGGLVRNISNTAESSTPILGKIPILGMFFRNNSVNNAEVSLMVFISPTIITPRVRGGFGSYTEDYMNISKQFAQQGGLFDSLRDPVTRWYFKSGIDAEKAFDEFTQIDEFKNSKSEMLSGGPTRLQAPVPNFEPTPEISENPISNGAPLPELAYDESKGGGDELKQLLQHTENPFV